MGSIEFIIVLLVIVLLFFVFRKRGKDTLKQIGLATSIKNTGYDSGATMLIIRNIIIKSLEKDGFKVIDMNIVHEFAGRYQGVIHTQEHGQTTLKIVADKLGNLQWSVID